MQIPQKETLIIDNFRGSMTWYNYGDINSGRSSSTVSSGQNPFLKPGQLSWSDTPIQIDAAGSVITDMIVAGKERLESNILYVYAVGHTGRVYKIQVNDPASYNPDLDSPVLLTTLTTGSPTFTRGGFIEFYGSTEKIYIGHDKGVTSITFAGGSETVVGVVGSWVQNVPRQMKQFLGKLYIANGSNLAELDTTLTITSYTKLSPGFPDNTQVRDMDLSTDGNYLHIVVSRLALENITSTTQAINSTASSDSFIFYWNGTDTGYTAFKTYPSFSLTANIMFQNYNYVFGYDQFGSAVFDPNEKFFTAAECQSPLPNAIVSTGNQVMWVAPTYFNGVLEVDLFCWGHMNFEIANPLGYYDLMFMNATAPETDIIRTPCVISVSNAGLGSSSNGYANNQYGSAKIYFSTLETSSGPTTKYRFYKWSPNANLDVPTTKALPDGIYQTQTQMFSKKISISEVRIYGEPWVADNSFQIDLIGSDGLPITGGSYTFTAGSTLTVGDDYAWYSPDMKPTYAIGVAITNKGTANHTINKIEIDWGQAGK